MPVQIREEHMEQPKRAIMSKIVSELAMTHALLNCLIKEFALPSEGLYYEWPKELEGLQPESCLNGVRRNAIPMRIQLSQKHEIFVLVDRRSSLGSQRYLSDVYLRDQHKAWVSLTFNELAKFLLEVCTTLTGAFNDELFEQVLCSQKLVRDILDHQNNQPKESSFLSYIHSEQSLLFGHPSHPAPKARLWPESLLEKSFSPEFKANTPLHCFAVPLSGVLTKSNGLEQAKILAAIAPQESVKEDQGVISMHPAQAYLFKQDKRVAALLSVGIIVDLGLTGFNAQPTASIRTWYIENHDYFIKGSLNVRITNCVRKNAWYELESALIIDKLFVRLQTEAPTAFKGGLIAREPAMLSWSPDNVSEEDQQWFREQTGIILRENFCKKESLSNSVLAATVFARNDSLQPMIWSLIGDNASDKQLLQWFTQYQALLLEPILSLFLNQGIVTEPHLQNIVLVHQDGMPKHILLRDFEGVKLTREKGVKHLHETLHPRVEASLIYPHEQGWKRIIYCLFVNNLSEAVLALSWERPLLAEKMWHIVEQQLRSIQKDLVTPSPELDELIKGGEIACKCNLKVRLAANADKQAEYVCLKAPWTQEVTCA